MLVAVAGSAIETRAPSLVSATTVLPSDPTMPYSDTSACTSVGFAPLGNGAVCNMPTPVPPVALCQNQRVASGDTRQ